MSDSAKILEMLSKIDKDLTEFKGDVKTELKDTNGRLKGNHELIIQKFESHERENKMQSEILNTRMLSIEKEQLNQKDSIRQLYDLNRTSAKDTEESNALVTKEVDAKITGYSHRIDTDLTNCKGSIIKIENTMKIMFGILSLVGPIMIIGVVYGIMLYQKVFGG